MKYTSFFRTQALCTILGLISLGQASQAAVTITISGDPSSSAALVELSGSFLVEENTATTTSTNLHVPVNPPLNSDLWFQFGSLAGTGGGLLSSPFAINSGGIGAAPGPLGDSASVILTNSVGGSLFIHSPNDLFFAVNGSYGLRSSTSVVFPSGVAADDVMTFSGSFDLDLDGTTFADTFVAGTHTGATYNGQDVTIVVVPVPEPSSMLLGLVGFMALLRRRR